MVAVRIHKPLPLEKHNSRFISRIRRKALNDIKPHRVRLDAEDFRSGNKVLCKAMGGGELEAWVSADSLLHIRCSPLGRRPKRD